MGLARLWSIFNEDSADLLPTADVARIKNSFVEYFGDGHDQPVVKIPLEIVKVGTRLEIIPFQEYQAVGEDEQGRNQEQQAAQRPAPAALRLQANDQRQVIALLQRNQRANDEQFDAIRGTLQRHFEFHQEQYNRIVANQRRYGGSIHSAMARRDRNRQLANNRNANAAAAQAQGQG